MSYSHVFELSRRLFCLAWKQDIKTSICYLPSWLAGWYLPVSGPVSPSSISQWTRRKKEKREREGRKEGWIYLLRSSWERGNNNRVNRTKHARPHFFLLNKLSVSSTVSHFETLPRATIDWFLTKIGIFFLSPGFIFTQFWRNSTCSQSIESVSCTGENSFPLRRKENLSISSSTTTNTRLQYSDQLYVVVDWTRPIRTSLSQVLKKCCV